MSSVPCDWRAGGRCTREGDVGLPIGRKRMAWACQEHFAALTSAADRNGRSTVDQANYSGVFVARKGSRCARFRRPAPAAGRGVA